LEVEKIPKEVVLRIALLVILLLAVPGIAFSSTINVPRDYTTIQDAIRAATDGDIVLVDDGVYKENINFLGKAITITSCGGANRTIIDGNAKGSVVTFATKEGPKSVIDGFTLCNGSGTKIKIDEDTFVCGGAIYCTHNTSPTITNNVIKKNKVADFGGGIFCDKGSHPKIKSNILLENKSRLGGGIYCHNESYPVVQQNNIFDNKAETGGAIYCGEASIPTICNNIIGENSAGEGYEEIEGVTTGAVITGNTYE